MKYLVLISLLFLMACGKNGSNDQPVGTLSNPYSNPGAPNLYVYGDSISYGLTHPTYDELFTLDHGLNLVQKSIGGTSLFFWTQYAAIADYDTWAPNDIIMFAPGANDAILFENDTEYQSLYRQGIATILARFKASGSLVYFGTPNHSCNPNRFYGPDSILDTYAQINRDEFTKVNAQNIVLVDYAANFKPTADNTIDCYHPNVQGYQEMYKILQAVVRIVK